MISVQFTAEGNLLNSSFTICLGQKLFMNNKVTQNLLKSILCFMISAQRNAELEPSTVQCKEEQNSETELSSGANEEAESIISKTGASNEEPRRPKRGITKPYYLKDFVTK